MERKPVCGLIRRTSPGPHQRILLPHVDVPAPRGLRRPRPAHRRPGYGCDEPRSRRSVEGAAFAKFFALSTRPGHQVHAQFMRIAAVLPRAASGRLVNDPLRRHGWWNTVSLLARTQQTRPGPSCVVLDCRCTGAAGWPSLAIDRPSEVSQKSACHSPFVRFLRQQTTRLRWDPWLLTCRDTSNRKVNGACEPNACRTFPGVQASRRSPNGSALQGRSSQVRNGTQGNSYTERSRAPRYRGELRWVRAVLVDQVLHVWIQGVARCRNGAPLARHGAVSDLQRRRDRRGSERYGRGRRKRAAQ